jgi:hypothetical protein
VKFVSAKSLEQQSVLTLHSARCLLVKQQTMLGLAEKLTNQARAKNAGIES